MPADRGVAVDHRVVLDGLVFPEGPRWHKRRLWFSDQHDGRVMSVHADGTDAAVELEIDHPSGLAWLPDGRLIVVAMRERMLYSVDADGTRAPYADLSPHTSWYANDLLCDAAGRCYVGEFGFDLDHCTSADEIRPGALVLVDEAGTPVVADPELMFPNGMVLTDDGATLVVAETLGQRLTAYDVSADGSLAGRREWAALPGVAPDGICLDAEGAVWVASPATHEVLRVRAGGEITRRVSTGELGAYACMLGGDDGRTLFVCAAGTHIPDDTVAQRRGTILALDVDVARAGRP
jgi:sugar lactone lactonase YvrE